MKRCIVQLCIKGEKNIREGERDVGSKVEGCKEGGSEGEMVEKVLEEVEEENQGEGKRK